MNKTIAISAGGQILHHAPPQQWRGDGVMQTALFAGQSMTLGESESGGDGVDLSKNG